MKNKIIALLLIITILSITAYARGYLGPGVKVTRGDATEVCYEGYGLVDNCRIGEGCSSDVYCGSSNDAHDTRIVKNIHAKWLTK